jgi:hypothetical protein
LHHSFGRIDPNVLKRGVIDILVCATARNFLPSVGGFSRLICHLNRNKELLNKLLEN